MAPETLKRSVSTLERFRLLDFMTKCRDEDVAVTHPGLNLKDKKIRPKQRSITWLTNQLRRPIKVPHLKSLLDKDNIVDQLRTHAAWIARYLRPMRANIYNQYFNVPIRQWEEFAERNSSLDTVTSLTMTKTDSSEDEALPVVPKAVIPRKRHIVESESEDEMFFDPKRLVRTRASARVVKIESTFDSDDEDLIGDEDEDEDDIAEITQDEFGGIQIPEVEDVIEWQDYEPEPEPERQTDHDHRVEQEQYVWDVLAATPSLQTAVPEDFRRTPQITDHRRWKCPVWACHFAIDLDNLDDAALNVLSAAEYLSLQTSRSGTSPNGARIVRRVVQDHYLKHVPGLRRLLEK
ncbi:hypothetical protein CALVIDRAFT_249306 [Calocera viscosa TUFC12733]|uniref:Uncharacterized protein n=1 Tax=Calocera viscosa (strain TUFC12733) TaxID=1330018 RepID=A0A167JCV8_CALVF|nr:hypothetical protein CALVIDRAFT_249306 [Calocera viscosa TUFC12733]